MTAASVLHTLITGYFLILASFTGATTSSDASAELCDSRNSYLWVDRPGDMGKINISKPSSQPSYPCVLRVESCSSCKLEIQTNSNSSFDFGQCSEPMSTSHCPTGCQYLFIFDKYYRNETVEFYSSSVLLQHYRPFVSASSSLFIGLCATQTNRFSLTYQALEKISNIGGSSGALTTGYMDSPYFSAGYVRNGEIYKYVFTSSNYNDYIRITFEDWNLAPNSNFFFNQTNIAHPVYGGDHRPVILSNSYRMNMIFHTGSSAYSSGDRAFMGFRFKYEFLPDRSKAETPPDTNCGGYLSHDFGGKLEFSATVQKHYDCVWVIWAQPGYSGVFLKLIDFKFSNAFFGGSLRIAYGLTSTGNQAILLPASARSYSKWFRHETGFYIRYKGQMMPNDRILFSFASYREDMDCQKDMFRCDNLVCIDHSLTCDTYDNCGDNTDETRGCDNTSPDWGTSYQYTITVGVIVPLVISVFLVIVICVLFIMIHRCRRRNQRSLFSSVGSALRRRSGGNRSRINMNVTIDSPPTYDEAIQSPPAFHLNMAVGWSSTDPQDNPPSYADVLKESNDQSHSTSRGGPQAGRRRRQGSSPPHGENYDQGEADRRRRHDSHSPHGSNSNNRHRRRDFSPPATETDGQLQTERHRGRSDYDVSEPHFGRQRRDELDSPGSETSDRNFTSRHVGLSSPGDNNVEPSRRESETQSSAHADTSADRGNEQLTPRENFMTQVSRCRNKGSSPETSNDDAKLCVPAEHEHSPPYSLQSRSPILDPNQSNLVLNPATLSIAYSPEDRHRHPLLSPKEGKLGQTRNGNTQYSGSGPRRASSETDDRRGQNSTEDRPRRKIEYRDRTECAEGNRERPYNDQGREYHDRRRRYKENDGRYEESGRNYDGRTSGRNGDKYDDRSRRYDEGNGRYDDRSRRYDEGNRRYDDRSSRYNEENGRYDDRNGRYNDRSRRYDEGRYNDRSRRQDGHSGRYEERSRRYGENPRRYEEKERIEDSVDGRDKRDGRRTGQYEGRDKRDDERTGKYDGRDKRDDEQTGKYDGRDKRDDERTGKYDGRDKRDDERTCKYDGRDERDGGRTGRSDKQSERYDEGNTKHDKNVGKYDGGVMSIKDGPSREYVPSVHEDNKRRNSYGTNDSTLVKPETREKLSQGNEGKHSPTDMKSLAASLNSVMNRMRGNRHGALGTTTIATLGSTRQPDVLNDTRSSLAQGKQYGEKGNIQGQEGNIQCKEFQNPAEKSNCRVNKDMNSDMSVLGGSHQTRIRSIGRSMEDLQRQSVDESGKNKKRAQSLSNLVFTGSLGKLASTEDEDNQQASASLESAETTAANPELFLLLHRDEDDCQDVVV